MLIFVFLIANFGIQYRAFLNSARSESIFVGLTRNEYELSDFSNDQIILWFWRSNSGSPLADSFLKKIPMERNFYLSAILRWEAKESNNFSTILNKLELATHFDSLAIENLLSFIALAVKSHKFNLFVKPFSLSVFSDIRNQVFIITNFIIFLFIALFMCGFIFILVKMFYYLPALSHRIDPQKHNQIKGIIPFLIILVPVLALRHPYLIFISYTLLLILIFNSHEKIWLRINIIILIVITLLSFPLNHFIPFLKGTDKSYKLYEMISYGTDTKTNPETIEEKKILAYALKQQGILEEALSLYEELYYQGQRSIDVINNLANIYFLYEEDEQAEVLYNQAASYQRGEPYFNLGLLKLKNIEYLASSKYMEEARKVGFSSLSKEPVDIKPGLIDFYKIIFSREFEFPKIINFIYIIPLLIILLFTFLPLRFLPPFFCDVCGQPICNACHQKIDEEITCTNCLTKLNITKNEQIGEDLRHSLGRSKRFWRNFLAYLVNIIIPGAGLIYKGRNFLGFFIVFFLMFGYIPLLFTHLFIKPTGWVAIPLGSTFLSLGVVIAIFCYLISFILMRKTNATRG